MECGLCGTANRVGARFCGGCGSPLARHCATCKAELDPDLRFCDQCGTPVADAEVPAAPPATGADAVRKTVTVLFADLGGSTGFGERTDPEVARQVLARYHALLQDVIDTHGGNVAKFMGDGMMATFGIPEVAEDDAVRAVRAGIDFQARFQHFAAEVVSQHDEVLTARVGINTGEVVIGAGDADIVGDALNVAARLEKACRAGHVLVGDETWRLTRGAFSYEPLGEVVVAGRAQPVGTYEVAATEAQTVEPVAPFVGRDEELDRLLAVFDRARRERVAVLATVLGSPGLGKTRLSRELATRVAAETGATTYEIRCDRSGGSTFGPVADLIREAVGIEDTETDRDRADLRERIGAVVGPGDDRDRLVDVLAGVLGLAPSRSVEETFWAVRRTLESLAAEHPVLVVIDDVQWAEPKLLDLVEHLGEWVTDAPVLLVSLARPELRELRPALVEPGRRVADVLALDGLDSGATEALAAGLLGSELPPELVDRLPASTDGNPLFVRELVRMLVDDRVVRRRDDGTWELAIDADAVEVPPTIQSLLATRVERLPPDELRALELASVIGAEFSVGALRDLAGDGLAISAVLQRMRRKELVEPTGAYWGDEPIHRFHHVLIRDAAYRRLLKGTRAELHRRVAEWTDATADQVIGEHEAGVAFHYEQAHRYRTELGALDDETERLGRRAAELLGVAAHRALDRDDLAAAGALARRALTLVASSDLEARAELLLMACECLLASGDVGDGAPLVDELTGLGTTDAQLGAWASCFRAQLVGLTDPEGLVEAEKVATRAAETLSGLGDGAGEAKAHQVRALLLARLGRVGEAETVLDLALGAARAADDRRRVTAVLGAAPQAALFGPSPVARAGGRCLDVVRLLRITTASPSVEATSMRCQAVLEALRGRFDVSRSMLASARTSLEELGMRHGLLETDLFTGMVELLAGDTAAAVPPLRAAYEGLGTLGVGADAGQAAALLATALLAQGETDEAELTAAASEALAGQNLKTAIAWRTAKAAVLAARDEIAEAVALARKAVEIAAATDLVLDHADACVVLADLRDQAGDAAGARDARADARRLYEAKGATVPATRLEDGLDAPALLPSAASDALDERYAVRDAPDERGTPDTVVPDLHNAATRVSAAGIVAIDAYLRTGRFEASPAVTWADDFIHEDHRAIVAMPVLGLSGVSEAIATMRDQGYVSVTETAVAIRGARIGLTRRCFVTESGDETRSLALTELDDRGRMIRAVLFDDGDLDLALDELDARYVAGEGAHHAETQLDVADRPGPAPLHNQASDVIALLLGAANQPSTDLGAVADWSWVAEDVVRLDRRRVVAAPPIRDREGFARNATAFFEVYETVSPEVVAVRGDRLALIRLHCGRAPEFVLRLLVIYDFDEHGRLAWEADFDDDDLTAALDELDERYVDGEGAEHEYAVQRFGDFRHALGQHDWAELERLLSPELVAVDRRRVGLGDGGREAYLAATRAMVELVPDVRVVPQTIECAGNAVLARTFDAGSAARGGPVEWSQHLVLQLAGGLVVRLEAYPLDDEVGARRRFAQLAAQTRTPHPDNEALRSMAHLTSLIARGALPGEALYSDDCVLVDRRAGVNAGEVVGGRSVFESVDSGVSVFGDLRTDLLASRGERLVLIRWAFIGPDDFEAPGLSVIEADDEGRVHRMHSFDESDLATAIAALDARYHELAPGSPFTEDGPTAFDLFNQRDWDGFAARLSPDLVEIDHSPLGFPPGGRDEFVDGQMRHLVAMVPDAVITPVKVIEASDAVAVPLRTVGTTTEGSRWEWTPVVVAQRDRDGLVGRLEFFPDDRWDEALARFDELTSAPAPAGPPPLDNAAFRTLLRASSLRAAGDRRGATALVSPDVVATDARTIVSMPTFHGHGEFGNAISATFDVYDSEQIEPIAIRGDRVVLARVVQDHDGFSTTFLNLWLVDEEQRLLRGAIYEERDLARAVSDLNVLHRELGDAPEVEHLAVDALDALNRRDWDAFAALLDDDLEAVDHQLFGFPPAGHEEFVSGWMQGLVDLAPDLVAVPIRVVGGGPAALVHLRSRGTTVDGNAYEWDTLVVSRLGPGARLEFFPPDRWDDALARFDEWSRSPLETRTGSEAVPRRTIARRGARLSLVERAFESQAGVETVELVLEETDRAGQVVRTDPFEDDALVDALEQLETRHLELLGDATSIADRSCAESAIVINRRDPEAFERLMVPDVTVVDHLPLHFPPASTSSDFRRVLTRLYELAPDTVFVTTEVVAGARASLAVMEQRSTTPGGNHYVWVRKAVTRYSPDGRIEHIEYFPEDRGVDARAQFDAWVAATSPTVVTTRAPENAATRLSQRLLNLTADGRYDEAVARFRPDFHREDRRSIVSFPPIHSAAEYMEWFPTVYEQFDTIVLEPIAVRGERLYLCRTVIATNDGFASVFLHLAELDDAGSMASMVNFDEGDVAAAVYELDQRYLAGEGADHAPIVEPSAELWRSYNARDWDAARARLADDIVFVDHEPVGAGSTVRGADLLVEVLQGLIDLVPDLTAFDPEHLAFGTRRALSRHLACGTSTDGATAQIETIVITEVSDGRFIRTEAFALDQLTEAWARFEELESAEAPSDPNRR